MSFDNELHIAFTQLQNMLLENHSADLLTMPYAEFSLKCYVSYAERIHNTILHSSAPLTRAFLSIGVDTPRDQLLILLNTFYLCRRTDSKQPC